MKNLKTNNGSRVKEIVCDCCAHVEEIEYDSSDMDSLMNASKKINELFRVKGDTHLCNENCEDVSFESLNRKFDD